jgi:predicted AlkP superfamily pyrophosphatase or phosphodiesterase
VRVGARRTIAVVVGAAVIAGAAAYLLRDEGKAPTFDAATDPTLEEMGDRVGVDPMRMVVLGNYPERTGEILLVPTPHAYLGPDASLKAWGTEEPYLFTSHPNPWSYLARVPIIVRGDGWVEPGATNEQEVDLTGLAPTYAKLLGTEFDAEGSPLPGIDYGKQPKLIFTIVIDGGGWNVLNRYPDAWPNIARLMDEGTMYTNASIGSFPAQTGSIHANIGTGEYPRKHGVPYNFYFEQADPQYLEEPTIGDLWDQETNNEAIVGTISVLSAHLSMIGHGAALEGGDRDIGVVWDSDNHTWITNETFYEIPDYIADIDQERLGRYEAQNDARDGAEDGTWFGNTPEELLDGYRRSSNPAFEKYQGDDIISVIRNESLGLDDVADLFYVQLKSPDQAGHIWNMVNPEIEDVLKEADVQIGRIVETLDDQVGPENYVLALTADHGQQPVATPERGWMINSSEVERDVEAAFDIEARVRSHQLNITSKVDKKQLGEIARFLGSYTVGDNIPEGVPGEDRVAKGLRDELVFAGAFPTSWISGLREDDLAGFGPSEYPEGKIHR